MLLRIRKRMTTRDPKRLADDPRFTRIPIDDGELSDAVLKELDEADAESRRGEVLTHEQVKQMLRLRRRGNR
ncbi:MAG: hypothetical protein O3A46_02395 [Candidatus Poribacteria bacterium]|nr:hypothetical protein [Candidatus Poribacteria bacterium]